MAVKVGPPQVRREQLHVGVGQCVIVDNALGQHLLGDGDAVDGGRELLGREDVLEHVIAKVQRGGGLPLGAVLEELVEVLPVSLKLNIHPCIDSKVWQKLANKIKKIP